MPALPETQQAQCAALRGLGIPWPPLLRCFLDQNSIRTSELLTESLRGTSHQFFSQRTVARPYLTATVNSSSLTLHRH